MFMLDLMIALGFFTDNNNVVGWEKKIHEEIVLVCLNTEEVIKGAEAESDYQFLDIAEVDGEYRPVFSYCVIAPMNDPYYYGETNEISKR